MNKGKYILVNGSFVPDEEYRISLQEEEAFLFSGKIRAVRTSLPFFRETLELIQLKLQLFNQSFPEFTANNGKGLKRQLERTLTKNKQFMGAVLTILFRLSDQKIQYTIQSEKLDDADFDLNEKGLYLDVFDQIQKPGSASLSNLSLGSEIYWNITRNHIRNSTADQLALVNTEGHLIEVPASNLYLIKGDTIQGAGIEQGAYVDITRPLMLRIFKSLNLEYSEITGISREDIREADEVMTVNAIEGIRWIVGYEDKRFFNQTIRKIVDLFSLNLTN